jgi:transcriptional regulator with XRE-family HTH domain
MSIPPDRLRIAIEALGGMTAVARKVGCSKSLVRFWLTGEQQPTAEKALRLRDLIIALSGTLPTISHDLKTAAEQARLRELHYRAQRQRWAAARGDKPRLTPWERHERHLRNRAIFNRLAAGEALTTLAEEYGTQPKTIERWARRGAPRRRGATAGAATGSTEAKPPTGVG